MILSNHRSSNKCNIVQRLLDGLYTWCINNNMTINAGKSNVVHFRLPSMERSKYIFKCGDMNIELTNNYAYLGLILNEFLDFNLKGKIVAKSSNRALGLVMANARQLVVFHMMCLRN